MRPEQINAICVRTVGEWAVFCLVFLMDNSDLFQDEATRCRDNAKRATNKDDREFWLNMANRWETMQRISKRETPEVEVGTIEHPRAA
jgi:hypothetical protein